MRRSTMPAAARATRLNGSSMNGCFEPGDRSGNRWGSDQRVRGPLGIAPEACAQRDLLHQIRQVNRHARQRGGSHADEAPSIGRAAASPGQRAATPRGRSPQPVGTSTRGGPLRADSRRGPEARCVRETRGGHGPSRASPPRREGRTCRPRARSRSRPSRASRCAPCRPPSAPRRTARRRSTTRRDARPLARARAGPPVAPAAIESASSSQWVTGAGSTRATDAAGDAPRLPCRGKRVPRPRANV